jgi:hypothetical protein
MRGFNSLSANFTAPTVAGGERLPFMAHLVPSHVLQTVPQAYNAEASVRKQGSPMLKRQLLKQYVCRWMVPMRKLGRE